MWNIIKKLKRNFVDNLVGDAIRHWPAAHVLLDFVKKVML